MKPAAATLPVGPPHSRAEDILALLIGSSFVGFALVLLKTVGLVTGGLAGVTATGRSKAAIPLSTQTCRGTNGLRCRPQQDYAELVRTASQPPVDGDAAAFLDADK